MTCTIEIVGEDGLYMIRVHELPLNMSCYGRGRPCTYTLAVIGIPLFELVSAECSEGRKKCGSYLESLRPYSFRWSRKHAVWNEDYVELHIVVPVWGRGYSFSSSLALPAVAHGPLTSAFAQPRDLDWYVISTALRCIRVLPVRTCLSENCSGSGWSKTPRQTS